MKNPTEVDDLITTCRKAIETAFKRGFDAGGVDMRDKILAAAGAPQDANHTPTVTNGSGGKNGRLARGTVGKTLAAILKKEPGLKISEVEIKGAAINKDVASKSYGNELRRLEGKKYKRDEENRWSLLGN